MKGFAIHKTDLGFYLIGYSDNKITEVRNVESELNFKENIDMGVSNELTEKVASHLNEYFAGIRTAFDIPFLLNGTEFQLKVWEALLSIPYGETRSYKDIAIQIGSPKAARAIGLANNKNPIAILIPCHRVIGSNGKLVGYAAGLDIKDKLLKIEKTHQ